MVALAYMLVLTTVQDYQEDRFSGGVLWLQRWELWSESIDRAGYVLLHGIRSSVGRSVLISSAPAHLFESGEFAAAHAALSLPMLFQWDAHFVSATGEFAAYISHEGSLDLVARDAEVHRALTERFHQWEPVEVPAI
ncbi:MAG: hypothetical protein AVDCRST_MAG68-3663 [uncultured Gemmatimonadetes bacterium]|uniref:Uncharacterized protein n=1 Tax=uncultured Gemmatimonadota bacterium TaxID=203437 RepID=A0A6J4M8D7_9BACT|nr:MAG: hypothetical protein AVDCRST_MAG68-3663 [uncultured Gemmatimonadota bacterium]